MLVPFLPPGSKEHLSLSSRFASSPSAELMFNSLRRKTKVLLSDLGFCLSCVAQNCAVLSFLPNELRASASFVEDGRKGGGRSGGRARPTVTLQ